MPNGPGRPRIIKSPEEFDRKADAYFAECKENDEPATWNGLALALGFCDRVSLEEYKKYDGYSGSVKRALTRVQLEYEKRLHGVHQSSGAIFALKNFGWRDEQTIHNRNMDVSDKPMSADEWEKNNVQ
jgi:hypothetical protein